ncbi:MAG: polysaccharide biosynthesis/export family protein [Thermodesulfobacteriota bacterium]
MKRLIINGFFLLLSVLWGWAISLPVGAEGDYRLGPEDVIEITVWGHQDLQRQVAISLDGTITFPLIGEVRAAGQSVQVFEKVLAAKLANGFLINPQVTINVKEYKSQKVFIMGEVKSPGTYPVTKKNDLLYTLSLAGGFTPNAGNEVMVVRPKNPRGEAMTLEEAQSRQEKILRVNLKEALGGDNSQNILIYDGDSIIVPKMPFFYVLGEVKNPGKYNLEQGTTVLMGISMAGGLTPKSAEKRTRIVREIEGKKQELRVKMDELVRPGDTIIVPESFF